MADLTEAQKESYWRYNITLTTILLDHMVCGDLPHLRYLGGMA